MSKYKYDFTLDTAEKNTSHSALASRIKPKQRILELGCSYGYLSKFLKEELACYVVGVDMDGKATEQAAAFCDRVITTDLDRSSWLSELKGEVFDWVLCADVLEHLKNPVDLLAGLKPFLSDEGCIAASVPNVAHASIRLELLQGHFDYESLGILDETHLHFYTRDGLISLFMNAGYICSDISYSTRDLADEAIEQCLANVGLKSSETLLEILRAPDAVAYQFIIEARPAKQELLKNLPQPLTPKPLVTSGVFYDELKNIIASLEIHNKNHQEQIIKLEEKIELIDQQKENHLIDNTNLNNNIEALEEKIKSIEQQRDVFEQQRDAQREHNQSHKNEIVAWHETTSLLDTVLFNLTEQYQIEQENNKNLNQELSEELAQVQGRSDFLSNETQRLEGVLNHIHRKISYRLLQAVKNMPKKITGVFSSKIEKETAENNSSQNLAEEINFHDYSAWLAAFGDLTDKKLDSFKADIASWQSKPKIAVLMPVYNPSKSCLENAIESVLQQVYGHFELCIADDASTESHVREVLEYYAQKDQRIKVTFREKNGHISEASNTALLLVEADYVALMDHDDLLTADALYWVAKTINQNPDVQLIYSDEDKMDLDGKRYAPYFKPDWNPELLLSHNFICHLGVYKTEKVKALGGFDSAFNGAQDFDLALRYIADLNSDQIQHIPRILYHWRAVEGSTANGVHEKHYAETNIAKAVRCALQRQKRPAQVMAHALLPGALRVRYDLPEKLPLVSIVIPTRNGLTLLRRCIESIFDNTRYTNYEVIIVDNGSDDFVVLRYLQHLEEDKRVTIIRDNSPFNYAALNNNAVSHANGDIIALLNNDLEVINDDWLDEMVSHVVHSEVGAVGAKLYYPNDTVQHAGVIIGLGGVAGHSHKHFPRDNPGYCGRLLLTQNFSAVTAACMLVRKEVFNAVGGFDAKNLSVAFNDVDLCLRIGEQGYDIVWTPYAEMYHYESATRGYEDTPEKQARFTKEVNYMKQRWGKQLLNDRAYNPNLTTEREDFSFSWNKSE